MQRLFGVPIGSLAAMLAVLTGAALASLGALALRDRVLARMSLRGLRHRAARTTLIVVGLMLGTTIIASALTTGDTVSHTVRSTVGTSLGGTDEIVAVKGVDPARVQVSGAMGMATYLPQATAQRVAEQVRQLSLVDGAAPAIIELLGAQDVTSRRTEPRVTLFASDPAYMAGFGQVAVGERAFSLGDLAAGEVLLNRHAANELSARPGDRITLYTATGPHPLTVRAIAAFDGSGTSDSAVLTSLKNAQGLVGQPNKVKYILVSNKGGTLSGAKHSAEVQRQLEPIVTPLGLSSTTVKQDGIDAADDVGSSFVNLFTTFGMFSISAGALLIFLIFVMLAAERRGEMGISRAIGMQRRHLVEQFTFEGALYDVGAALVGALLGLSVSYGMVTVMTSALGTSGIKIEHYVQGSSIVVAYTLGVLLTLVVVLASASRVSRLNIVAAIRDLPEMPTRHRRAFWLRGGLTMLGAALLLVGGIASQQATSMLLGVSLVFVGLVPIAQTFRVPARAAYTAGGLALVTLWCLPFTVQRSLLPGIRFNFSVWVVGGIMIVLGATWVLMNNADWLLTRLVAATLGRIRAFAPVVRTAVAYPLRNRFRTGTTVAMFTLVVFTLVCGAVTTMTFTEAFNDVKSFGGGFDVRAEVTPAAPVGDLRRALSTRPGLNAGDYPVVASESVIAAKMTQAGSGHATEQYAVRGFDTTFFEHTSYELAATARGYGSTAQVWRALSSTPNLAVVDSFVAPHRDNWSFGGLPAFQLSGFYVEDKVFDPVAVDIVDPRTGKHHAVSVIGVLRDSAPLSIAGVLTSQRTLAGFGEAVAPTIYHLTVAQGVDPSAAASRLESAFLANGMQADAVSKLLSDNVAANLTMNRLVLGFIALGLVVGVAALGVISARSVVERRQQIGVLRAIGFQRRQVQAAFLTEASSISLVSIVLGTALGLIVARNVIAYVPSQLNWGSVPFVVPWLELVLIFVIVYAACLLTSWVSARRAARVYPAEALRYQ